MALDLDTLFNRRFEFESATLGRLSCRSPSMEMLRALEKILGEQNIDGRRLTVRLVEQVAERVPDGEQGRPELKGNAITTEEANQLSDEEIEAFARGYLADNPDLLQTYEGAKREFINNEKGERIFSITPQPLELRKDPDERDSDYLVRVLRRYLDEQRRMLKNIAGPFSGISKPTVDALRQNLEISQRLRRLTGWFETGLGRSTEIERSAFRMSDLSRDSAYETIARLNDVISHLQELRPLAAECANLFRSMNDTSIHMLADFGNNAQRTEKYTKIAITIAAASLVISALFSGLNYFREDPADRLTKQISDLSEAQDRRTERLIAAFEARLSKQSSEDRKAFVEALRESMKPREQTSRGAARSASDSKAQK